MRRKQPKAILRRDCLREQAALAPRSNEFCERAPSESERSLPEEQGKLIDAKLAESFQQFPVPADLRMRLLAARKIAPVAPFWRRSGWIAAAAACLALLCIMALLPARSPRREFAAFHAYVADTAATLNYLELKTTDRSKIREWLRRRGAPENFVLPAELSGKSAIGCRVFRWNKQKVSLVCFAIGHGKVAHLFVIDGLILESLPNLETAQFSVARSGIAMASWRNAGKIYILALKDGGEELKQLLL